MKTVLYFWTLGAYMSSDSHAFGVTPKNGRIGSSSSSSSSRPETNLAAIDPTILVAAVSAAAGSAAGALSQQPRIQALETETIVTKEALNATREEMQGKIADFEEKLHVMDEEYEAQTTQFKKEYEARMKQELKLAEEKAKTDYKYKLEIEKERQKSNKLSEKYTDVNAVADRGAQLSALRMEMQSMLEDNRKLREELQDTAQELEGMKEEMKGGSSFLGGLFK